MSQLTAPDRVSTNNVLYDEAVVLLGHQGAVLCSKFNPDGSCIASGGMDRTVRLWQLPTDAYEELPNYGVMEEHKSAVTSLNWKDADTLFTASADSTVAFWDAVTGERTRRGLGHNLTVNDNCVTPNGICISVGDDGCIKSWDERQKAPINNIDDPYPLLCCDSNADGSIVYVAGIDPTVKAYDLLTNKLIWSCLVGYDIITGLSLNSDESRLIVRLMNGKVVMINSSKSVPEGVSRLGPSYEGTSPKTLQSLVRCTFSRDDIYIASGSDSAEAMIWETASRRIQSRFQDHEDTVLEVDFHPTEKVFLSCSGDGNIVVRQL